MTATRSERSPEDVPTSVTLVPRAAVEATPSRTLDDALRTVVGLNLPLASSNVLQPINDHVSMRGLGGDRVAGPRQHLVRGLVQQLGDAARTAWRPTRRTAPSTRVA